MNNTKLENLTANTNKWGLTTGVCAAAAAKAAVLSLYENIDVKITEVNLPTGDVATLKTIQTDRNNNSAKYYVQKPDNSDPDITKNIRIYAEAEKSPRIEITGGPGIGKITKPGLACPVGAFAINPVPLKMIESEIKDVLPKTKGAKITISAPEGISLAEKTFNKRLGILGGISILGTTGYVKPMSVDAYKTALAVQINIAKSAGYSKLAVTPGNIGRKAALNLGFDGEAIIICSNFVGYILDKCKENDIKEIVLVGHLGKLLKIASSHFDTHSKKNPLDFKVLIPFIGSENAAKLNTAEEAIGILLKNDKDNLNKVAALVNEKIQQYLNAKIKTRTYIVNLESKAVGDSNG
jgi:cobalt-precorrin-5B (C1)-methyltransferase